MFHEGGPLGLGTTGPMGMGIKESMMRNPLATWGKLKFAMANPLIAGAGWLMDKFFPTGGERGGLGGTFGPRLADAASKLTKWGPRGGILSAQDWSRGGGGTGPMGGTFLPRAAGWASRLGIQGTPASRGTGIFGGPVGPWFADLFGFDPPGTSGGGIQEIDMSTLPTKRGSSVGSDPWAGYTGYIPSPSLAQYTSGFTPGQGKK